MKVSIQSFYRDFYGESFARHFVRIPDFKEPKIRRQFIVETPKQLQLHTSKNSGVYPCFITIYNNGNKDKLKQNDKSSLVFDRLFFDFDVRNDLADNLKKQLNKLRQNKDKEKQCPLKKQLRNLIIDNQIALDAINDAKHFSKLFKKDFGKDLALFFSGCKGCHAYTFFDPIKLAETNKTVGYFAEQIKNVHNLDSMDLAVNKDPLSRKSRIPYTKHQLTGLAVVPFNTDDKYDEIIEKAIHNTVETFDINEYYTDLHNHLQTIDERIVHNDKVEAKIQKRNNPKFQKRYTNNTNLKLIDHRTFFKELLGEPESKYSEREYVMYKCPFPDHEDNKPSFRVHRTGYYCYGCGRKGNYWQFLKDYNKWDDQQVKAYLRSRNIKN